MELIMIRSISYEIFLFMSMKYNHGVVNKMIPKKNKTIHVYKVKVL